MTSKIIVNNIEPDAGISTVTFNGNIVVSSGSTSAPSISPSGDSNTGIFFPSADTVAIGEGGVEALRIDSSGNVGIGTDNPSEKTHISGTGDIKLRVGTTSSGVNANAALNLTTASEGNYTIQTGNAVSGGLRFYDTTAGSERLRIDSSGRVTMPYQPYARASSTTTQGATNAIPLNSNASYNYSRGGITISGNRFTVPVAGAYVIGYHHLGNFGSGACQIEIRHNGTYIPGTRTQDTNSNNDSFGTQTVKELNASDYIEFWVIEGASHGNQDYNSMWIWLLG